MCEHVFKYNDELKIVSCVKCSLTPVQAHKKLTEELAYLEYKYFTMPRDPQAQYRTWK